MPFPLIIKGDLPTKLSTYVLCVYAEKSRDNKAVDHVNPELQRSGKE